MVSQTTVTLVDDVDGSEADETINFAVDGVAYEIDLNEANAARLREAFEKWIESGRRVKKSGWPGSSTTRPPQQMRRTQLPDARPSWTVAERHSMQRFAKANDLPVPAERGRISGKVTEAWVLAGKPN